MPLERVWPKHIAVIKSFSILISYKNRHKVDLFPLDILGIGGLEKNWKSLQCQLHHQKKHNNN